MKDEESNNLNESKGLSPQASQKLPYRPPFVRMLESPIFTLGKIPPIFPNEFRSPYTSLGPS
jgi:hypothetical protein